MAARTPSTEDAPTVAPKSREARPDGMTEGSAHREAAPTERPPTARETSDKREEELPTVQPEATRKRARASGPELREHPRVPYYLEANLYGDKSFASGVVTNLSIGGLYIECWDFFDIGDVVKIDVELPTGRLWCDALVKWVMDQVEAGQTPGMGVQFLRLKPSDTELLTLAVDVVVKDANG